ncbi:MAG: acetate/propionate family kinase [Acidobacteriaceae bacterium]|nr:acetate/propionate family kinase [Acidobacteriaceae bacterium]
MPSDILTINQGSSSLKFAVFEVFGDAQIALQFRGEIHSLHSAPILRVRDDFHQIIAQETWSAEESGHEPAFKRLLEWLRQTRGTGHIAAVGHRVVHGGDRFTAPMIVDDAILAALEEYVPLAPLHQPHNLSAISVMRSLTPNVAQVACFDTSFHSTIPRRIRRFALPAEYDSQGIHRFGFHGLSYEYIARELRRIDPQTARGQVVVAHLGAGVTLCAMQNGESIDTTTGLTALDGLPMATRCGAIDPGVLLYLMRERHFGVKELEDLLYHQSGLLGLSGISGDMRTLLENEDNRSVNAVEYFVFRVAREVAALTSTLRGLDGLVFTAGIGEHAPSVRSWICGKLAWLGVKLDEAANARDAALISVPESRVVVRVIPTDEERMIAEHTLAAAKQRDLSAQRLIA